MEHNLMSTLSIKELSHPSGEVIKIASGKTLDLKSQGSTTLPTGSILQVIYGSTTTYVTTSTTTFVDTGLTASITPSATSSKVLVIIHQNGMRKATGNTENRIKLSLFKGSSEHTMIAAGIAYTNSNVYNGDNTSITVLDSPSSTSAITYKTMFKNEVAASNVQVQHSSATSTITLIEVSA